MNEVKAPRAEFEADILRLSEIDPRTADHRALAIIAASYMEKHLTGVIRKGLPALSRKLDKDLFEGDRAPIGTLQAKIAMAEALAIIDADTAEDARIVAKIRNRFAHDLAVDSFDHEKVRDLVTNLRRKLQVLPEGTVAWGGDMAERFWLSAFQLCLTILHLTVRDREYKLYGRNFIFSSSQRGT